MLQRLRTLFLILLTGLLLLAACGGSDAGGNVTDDSDTTGTTNNENAAVTGARVKEDAALGSAPLMSSEDAAEGPAGRGAVTTSDVAGVCLSAAEGDLARMVNEYRASLNLPPLQISKSLSLVAQQHAWDTVNNSNAWPAPPAGKTCNMHSWSGNVNPALQQGTWTANCYTSDHANAQGMWNKPGQIAGFPGEGVENSFASSGTASASGALTAWKNSPGHNNVITQQGGWGPMASMGIGMLGGVAHLWLSWVADPAGEAMLCSGGSAMVPPPTAVPPTAVPPTAVPPTAVPPTAVPPTAAPTNAAATAAPTEAPTAVPPTVAPTAVPATVAPTAAPTGTILNENGTIAADSTTDHTFNVAQGQTYTVVVTPSAEFDVAPRYECTTSGGNASGGFDLDWEGVAETLFYTAPGNGTCRITVGGYQGSAGTYTIAVTAR